MKKIIGAIFAGALAIAVSGPAEAVTFDFTGDFFGSIAPDGDRSFTTDGITVDVTAGTFPASAFTGGPNPSDISFAAREVDQDLNGLGADEPGLFNDAIDGFFGNDVLVFTFDTTVRIDEITFTEVDGNDDFAFGSVDGVSFDRVVNFEDVLSTVIVSSFASDPDATGRSFGIGAIGGNDNFRIGSITVTAVPLPAPILMLGAALGGLMIARRRRRA